MSNRIPRTLAFAFCASVTATPGWADLPLTNDDLLIRARTVRLGVGLDYANWTRRNWLSLNNLDGFLAQADVRYGVSSDLEVYGRVSGLYLQERSLSVSNTTTTASAWRFNNLSLGLNYQFSPDTTTPALLGQIETSIVENASATTKTNFVYGKTWQVGLTTYRRFDPVVLALSIGYTHARPRQFLSNDRHLTFNPGNIFSFNPSLSFAINPDVSVSGGFVVTYSDKSELDNERSGMPLTRTELAFSLAFALNEKTIAFSRLLTDISGDGGSTVGLKLSHAF